MINPYNLLRHELTGLPVSVVEATDRGYMIDGVVHGETRDTITIKKGAREIKLPKKDVTLEFRLQGGAVVRVEGRLLVGRPEDRVKKKQKIRF